MSGISGMWTNTSGQYFPRTPEDDLKGNPLINGNTNDNPDKRYIDFPPGKEETAPKLTPGQITFTA